MTETSEMELDLLQRRAAACGHYVNRHKGYNPLLPGGDLYLMPIRKFRRDHVETILKFATIEQIEDELAAIEEENAWSARKSRAN